MRKRLGQGYVAERCTKEWVSARIMFRGPDSVQQEFITLVPVSEMREHFVGFYLNSRNEILCSKVLSIGSLNASIVHPREVLIPALEYSAAAFILAHNHPSGDPTPSEEDLAITRRLQEAGRLLGIELLDHVVVGQDGAFVSMKERRLLR